MCGIFGCIGRISEENAKKCIKSISHRGPDAVVVKELEGITLAHARLSIMDISESANQPMADSTGRYWIVYNGEVYNFLELRRELEAKGYRFRTDSDTEVILYAYIAWGMDFQYKCNGMWSVAIWDNLKKECFFSRDRFGVKPFYYFEQDGNFYFASEMKAFFPIMNERKINYRIFEKKDYFTYEATENCCIRDIKKILAGHCGSYRSGQLYTERWWNTLEHLMEVPDEYDEQVGMLRDFFLDACKIRMRSDVPIGTALSGGVDSSAVAGAMRYLSQNKASYINKDWQHAFVASMPDTVLDETRYAEMAAEHIGVEIQKVMVNAAISPSDLFGYMYICEDPYITSPIPFMQTYGSIAKEGIKVTIDGHGADELFGGYGSDLFYAALEVREDDEACREVLKTFNNMALAEHRVTFQQLRERVEALRNAADMTEDRNEDKIGVFNRRLYRQTHREVLPTLLRCYDRYSMGNGLEIRMPFMDYRIVCFAFSVPMQSKTNGGYTKKIVRDMAAPFMDRRVMYKKPKVGFNSPMTEWLQGEMKEFVLDTVHSKDFLECGLLNSLDTCIKVSEFYKLEQASYTDGESIWVSLVPYLWKKAMGL